MGIELETESGIARVAANLMAAWESGDRLMLEAAVGEAMAELGSASQTGARVSPFADELRELLLGIVQHLSGVLSAAPAIDFRSAPQREACFDLLRHAQLAAAASAGADSEMHASAAH